MARLCRTFFFLAANGKKILTTDCAERARKNQGTGNSRGGLKIKIKSKFRLIAIAVAALGGIATGQSATANPGQAGKPPAAPAAAQTSAPGDTQVLAELKQSLNTKKVHVGDPIKATVTQDVLMHGRIVIARETKLVGHVTEVKVRSDNDKESFIGLVFDKALLKGGREIQFNGTVAAMAAPAPMRVDDGDPMLSPPGSIVRDNVGGPQQAPRGTGLPSTDAPLNTAESANASAARMGRDTGSPGGSKSTAGLLSAGSRGVFGLPGLTLRTDPGGGHGSVISSLNHNVVLESGTQMLIQVNFPVHEQ